MSGSRRKSGSLLRLTAAGLTLLGGLGFVGFGIIWLVAAAQMGAEKPLGSASDHAAALAHLRWQAYMSLGCGLGIWGGLIVQLKRRLLLGGSLVLFIAVLSVFLTPKWAWVVVLRGVVVLAGVLAVIAGRRAAAHATKR